MKGRIKNIRIKLVCVLAALIAGIFLFSTVGSYAASAGAAKQPVAGNYYMSDYENKAEAMAAGNAINVEIMSEGITLLKNEDDALPLGEGANISVFGKRSADIQYGGSGAGGGGGGESVNLQKALTESGFNLNPSLISFYANSTASGSGRGEAPSNGSLSSGYNTGETPVSMYTTVEGTYADYDDAAIAIFSRIGGEGFDLPRTMTWNGSSYKEWGTSQVVPGARSGTDHYLQLDANESQLLKYLGEKFDKVIVLLNTGSQFETGFLDDPGHYGYHANTKAALWIGYPGGTGLRALGKILKGEVNPSGRTVDTYARDFKKDPTWANFGNNLTSDGHRYANSNEPYVYYKEGIYMGYRYYETRGHDEGFGAAYTGAINGTSTTAWKDWYTAHTVYPFGYGLSYTSFTQEIRSSTFAPNSEIASGGTINITVRVTNTGSYAGKEVVQLYYSSPYDPNGDGKAIEKAHVVLGAFEKTDIIQPTEYEDVVLKLKVRDMASYDFNDANANGFKGYELDAGVYDINLMRNAHDEIDSVTYTISSNVQLRMDEVTGNDVINRYDEISNEVDKYLSRSNWTGTFPTTNLKIQAKQWIIDKNKEWKWNGGTTSYGGVPDEGQPYYTNVMPTTGDDTGPIKLTDLVGLEYDDPLWEQFLDQLSISTMSALIRLGNYKSGMSLPSLGITYAINADGAGGWSYGTSGGPYVFYSSETVHASAWNKELSYRKGKALAEEGLHGTGADNSRFPGLYSPAINTHRSPFSGRNFEYYSEDGYITGMLSANFVMGAMEKGMFTYVKHFAINDQETSRIGLMTWASEQSMREIYLKGFELCVKVGKSVGMMSGLNRIGTVWAGGDYNLLTAILRDEWGFRGSVVTDTFIGKGYSDANQMIRAGGNLCLGNTTEEELAYKPNTPTTVTCMRNAVHGILYANGNSMAMNYAPSPTMPKSINTYLSSSLTVGVVGATYQASVATATINRLYEPDADDSLIVYTLTGDRLLPAGLTLNPDGSITGIPTEEANNHRFTVAATYDGFSREAIFVINIVGSGGAIIYMENIDEAQYSDLGIATAKAAYSKSVGFAYIFTPDETQSDRDNYPPVTYAVKNGHLLPEGLSLSSNGTLSGTPTKECLNYAFTVVASAIGYKSVEMTFSITINHSLTFTGGSLSTAKFGVSYLEKVIPAVCDMQVTYRLKTGSTLPAGLTLTGGGYITGTPTALATEHMFIIQAVADFTVMQEAEYKITVGLAFNPTILADGKQGEVYDSTVNTAQGAGGITYKLKDGDTLPAGLTLDKDGSITGTPTKAGVNTLTFLASADGCVGDEITLTLYIASAQDEGCNGTVSVSAGVITAAVLAGACVLLLACRKREKTDDTK